MEVFVSGGENRRVGFGLQKVQPAQFLSVLVFRKCYWSVDLMT